MRRGGSRTTMLLLGGLLSILAFVVLFVVLSQPPPSTGQNIPPTAVPKQSVVVAQHDIKGFTIIKAEDLTVAELDPNQVISPTTQIPQTLVNKMLTRDYTANDQINLNDVSDPGVSQQLKKGQRGFVLPIKEVDNFGGQLLDGDVVDVLWSRNFEVISEIAGPDGKPVQATRIFPTTKKILDNIQIVHVIHLTAGGATKKSTGPVNSSPDTTGQSQQQAAAAEAQAAQALYATAQDTPFSAALVLGITDQQAEVLKYTRETGTLSLTLRPKGDTDTERTTGITDKIMTEDYGVVLPEIIFK